MILAILPKTNKPLTNKEQTIVAVIGSGSWATALVKIISEGGHKVRWYIRHEEKVQHLLKHGNNPSYLADVQFNLKKVRPTSQLSKALKDAHIVIIAVPSAFVMDTLSGLKPEMLQGKIVVSAIKGLVPEGHKLVTDYLQEAYHVSMEMQAIISGPCHAEEVAMGRLSYLTVAGPNDENTQQVAQILKNSYIKSQTNKDLYGVEYAAIMKNIVALSCGIAHGLGYGDNFQAVLVANAMKEVEHFLMRVVPHERDYTDSVYLGDLLVTCYSQFSRNRTFGTMIGRGYSVTAAQMEMNMVAEGYYAVAAIHELNREHGVSLPITEAVFDILYKGASPKRRMAQLQETFV